MIQLGSTALLAQRVAVLASTALLAAQDSPSVVDATAGRFNAKLPTGFTTTLLFVLLLLLDNGADDFDDATLDETTTEELTDEIGAALLELLTEEDEGAILLELLTEDDAGTILLELLEDELPTLELVVPAIENLIQFRLIA